MISPVRVILAFVVLAAPGCRDGSRIGGLEPDPNPPTALRIAPAIAQLLTGDTVRFSVSGVNSQGATVPVTGVALESTGGSIDAAGLYQAAAAGNWEVHARFHAGTEDLVATALVEVHAPPPPGQPPPPPPPPPPPSGALGLNADLPRFFPADNPWNQPVDTAQVDPNSGAIVALIGASKSLHPDFGADLGGSPFGIPYYVVSGTQARVPVSFDYADESDPGPYPIPPNPPIEGGAGSSGDRHVLIVDRDAWMLYELFAGYPQGGGWHAGSGAVFNLNSNALRPAGWTSADAAGLPILPGLVRYDEVAAGAILHALRFTISHSQRAYIPPARHWASSDTDPLRPPMGMRVRLKASFNISGYPARVQVILRALKKYGMIVADNGSDWFLSGTADTRWNDGEINQLKQLKGSDFEVVRMQSVVTH